MQITFLFPFQEVDQCSEEEPSQEAFAFPVQGDLPSAESKLLTSHPARVAEVNQVTVKTTKPKYPIMSERRVKIVIVWNGNGYPDQNDKGGDTMASFSTQNISSNFLQISAKVASLFNTKRQRKFFHNRPSWTKLL